MVRTTRASYSCARCYKRKKKCDRNYPACAQCTRAGAQCSGLDRGSEVELPRSLVSYLEGLVAQLELERDSAVAQDRPNSATTPSQSNEARATIPPLLSGAVSSEDITAAYNLAATTAQNSAPATSFHSVSRYSLPYYRVFFMSAELPFPLAFREQRPINIPYSHEGADFTQLPGEVADKLVAVYLERILPQYPLFLKQDVIDIYQRFKMSDGNLEIVTSDEQFMISMIMAIATLTSRAKDYRKLVSVAESLRRDAFARLDFGLSSNNAKTITIKKLLLLAQYGYLLPSSTNLWQVVGDATRIASELGLHQVTPTESGVDEVAVDSRKRLFWTLYAIERSVAITSHRPYAIAEDQIHVPFPVSEDDPINADQISSQVPYIRFIDRLRFLRLQSEICSVNIGMRPIPNPQLAYEQWMVDVEGRITEASTQATTSRWSAFMEWHSLLLLHMPCARNPNPEESSVLKYFDAALRTVHGYWELVESDRLDYSWHATHHCYEAGNLILYSLWHFRALLRRHYTTHQVFEAVHQISGFFILIIKRWPAAQQCGILFDRLRKGALIFFREENSVDSESSLEAKQLKELLFRENADLLYASEPTIGQTTSTTMFPELNIDRPALGSAIDFHDFLDFDDFGLVAIENEIGRSNLPGTPLAAQSRSSTVPEKPAETVIDETQLRVVMQRLPVCSHCKKRRIKCDMTLPACRNCAKLHQECCYWDNALSEETSRKHIHALHQYVERLMKEVNELSRPHEPVANSSNLVTGPTSPDLARLGTRTSARPHSDILSNILCRPPLDAGESLDLVFFGATSSFARLAAKVGRSIPLPRDVATSVPRPLMLLETLCSSLVLNVTADISLTDAQNLAGHYYRSIESIYPILGQHLIYQTLDHIYSNSSVTDDDRMTRARFNLILAISLALLSVRDQRLQIIADTHLGKAISEGLLSDQFVHPTNKSLQIMLLFIVYAWIRPSAMDVWRLLGHASRMCLDIIEMHGSDKTDSAQANMLYQTLYTLETQVSIASGRPHQLPDRKEAQSFSPDPSLVAADELPTMMYNLARLQYRFYKDVTSHDYVSPGQNVIVSAIPNVSWMASCVCDIKGWLEDWKCRTDALFNGPPSPSGALVEGNLELPLGLWGEFQQCEALLLAKIATERRGQVLISTEDELTVCKQLLQAADSLHQAQTPPANLLSPYVPEFVFPMTWTHAHAIFTAMTVLLQHMHKNSPLDAELQRLFQAGLDLLVSFEHTSDNGITGIVNCIRNISIVEIYGA
ncbi:hypothetical protein F4677DRAFT_407525 [Hypoxylon crocopeplum]|nr:hypothetical protein F4677DRAFT_407525 [Hypoxylon crocopeplum]